MKKFFLLIILLFVFVSVSETYTQRKPDFRNISIREVKNRLIENLQELDSEYLQNLSYKDYRKAREILIESYNLLRMIPDNGITIHEEMKLLNEKEFAELCEKIKSEGFESDKIYVIQLAAKYNRFTVAQLITLIDLMSFSNDKIEVVKIVYPNVVDKYNSHLIINAFTHSSDKERVKKIINDFPDK
ncbi:Hypothetical protein IALB_2627 [Ignavibacterium album JCM 16511]|uniref:DUF4476 domain-containing protein n=1 Tax=Ignavibacterium album (strain DSM 19864 / JCM 16511 / NBRC 101810 / Mat9-16) TaxID=945713 RepID=I0AMX3_IGNAJ|nr:DUF4476 domain-containing protein [Ignavibacterium album]AFH50330.1 Hypothetical protein IALB_2627 [Ignavibacterium album JCM 16511]